jgi:nucleoid DNA-binding protein
MAGKELLEILREAGKAEGEAADELARAVEAILRRLKRGEPVSLPGVGRLVPGRGRQVRLEPAAGQRGRRGRD